MSGATLQPPHPRDSRISTPETDDGRILQSPATSSRLKSFNSRDRQWNGKVATCQLLETQETAFQRRMMGETDRKEPRPRIFEVSFYGTRWGGFESDKG